MGTIGTGVGPTTRVVSPAVLTKKEKTGLVVIGLCILLLVIGLVSSFFGGSDIETGKVYKIAATYRVEIQGPKGQKIPGRVFDFADRNLPRTSIAIPLRDERGVQIVVENLSMPPSTVRKLTVTVPEREIEGEVYPPYAYPLWEYHLATVEIQGISPTITPKR